MIEDFSEAVSHVSLISAQRREYKRNQITKEDANQLRSLLLTLYCKKKISKPNDQSTEKDLFGDGMCDN